MVKVLFRDTHGNKTLHTLLTKYNINYILMASGAEYIILTFEPHSGTFFGNSMTINDNTSADQLIIAFS